MRALSLFLQTIKKKRNSLLAYLVINGGLVWVLVAVFPSMARKGEELRVAFENYPEAMLKAFNIDMSTFLANLEGFLATENFSIMWPILLIILVVSFGAGVIAGEIEKGTIEILLAQPISRAKLFLTKYAAGIAVTLIFVFASVFSAIPFALLYNVGFDPQSYLVMSVLGSLFGVASFSLATMFSSIFSERGKAASLTSAVLIVMYALHLVAAFKESLDKLKYLSFFHYYDHSAAMLEHHIDPLAFVVFLGAGAVFTLIGLIAFTKRDIAV
jgi:ABC-2 type transport system permease protein